MRNTLFSDELALISKNSQNPDEFERAWKAAILRNHAEGNKYLSTLWDIKEFWVPAYFKDCFYPFTTTTTRSESTNSMWKCYVYHKDTIAKFVAAYDLIQQNCLATLDKKRYRTLEKTPSIETGFPIEREASKIYTNEIFRKFQQELHNRTYYKCSDLAKGRQYQLKRIPSEDGKPYPGEEFERSEFRVDVDEQKEVYNCTCNKMQRDGIQCCHVLKVMDQTGMVDQLPKSFINPRWTKNLSESLKSLATGQGNIMTREQEETMRFSLAYTEMAELCSHGCKKDKSYNVLMECMRETKIKVMAALAEVENEEPTTNNLATITLKNPPMSFSKGTRRGDRLKAGSENKGKGGKALPRCGRCKLKGHKQTSCSTNPAVIEKKGCKRKKGNGRRRRRRNL